MSLVTTWFLLLSCKRLCQFERACFNIHFHQSWFYITTIRRKHHWFYTFKPVFMASEAWGAWRSVASGYDKISVLWTTIWLLMSQSATIQSHFSSLACDQYRIQTQNKISTNSSHSFETFLCLSAPSIVWMRRMRTWAETVKEVRCRSFKIRAYLNHSHIDQLFNLQSIRLNCWSANRWIVTPLVWSLVKSKVLISD